MPLRQRGERPSDPRHIGQACHLAGPLSGEHRHGALDVWIHGAEVVDQVTVEVEQPQDVALADTAQRLTRQSSAPPPPLVVQLRILRDPYPI
ncbi:hypothetical protein A6A28_32735 [Streptomyces sp. CB03578]|nr:hypothetical protein A6A28_32735 [Streptomyces sp. CB03578]